MTLAFNPMDPVPGNRSRRITSKLLAGNLLSIAIGISLGILFVSLLLAPMQSYAAQARLDTTAVPPTHRLTVGPPTTREQVANIDEGQHAPVVAAKHTSPDSRVEVPLVRGPTEYRGTMVRLPGHVLPVLQRATLLTPNGNRGKFARLHRAQHLTLTLVLKRDDQTGFVRYLHQIYDPHSPNFQNFLTPAEIAARFGPSQQSYDTVLAYLRFHGFRLVEGSANHLTITVRGTRTEVERAFGVRTNDYRIGDRVFYANETDPWLPEALASKVEAINGLSDFARPHDSRDALLLVLLDVACTLGITAAVFDAPLVAPALFRVCVILSAALWYDLLLQLYAGHYFISRRPVPVVSDGSRAAASPINGAGQTIGLVEFDTFALSDVTDYLALFGAPPTQINNLSQVNVNGGATPGSAQDEVLLDIDTAMTIAPGAKVAVYDAPFAGPGVSFQALFNKMINDHVSVISNSWAYCENQTTLADARSIDSILATAAASGISVFNGSGDSGSTCLDGSPNTVSVPADSPNATAVGGSSLTAGPGISYGSETWWNGTAETPPNGQGGFGTSEFFSRPSYQDGLSTSAMRSVPDVVVNADPTRGAALICQASKGGCPSDLQYGGTSIAAPIWASFTALINQQQGHNLGFLNPMIYPLAGTAGFHNAASFGTDFAHVGLGSPNGDVLSLLLSGKSAGPADPTVSTVIPFINLPLFSQTPKGVPADGTSTGDVSVQILDANENIVSGKTITLTANAGSHAKITPASGVSSVANGTVNFTVSNADTESVTFTATDDTDGVILKQTAMMPFITPVATAAGLDAFPASVTANGASLTTITLTLKDTLGRPTPGKLVSLSQGSASSVIKGPNPGVTDASGQVVFTAVDQVAETVTYSAIDITDGNLPFPTTAAVTFTSGPATGCGNSTPLAAPGFRVAPYATGFIAQPIDQFAINFGCWGVSGIAFDKSGNLYANYFPTGDIYKFAPGGGVADASTLLTAKPLGPTLAGLAFDSKGNLYASLDVTTAQANTGAVIQVDPVNGALLRTISPNLTCPTALAVDPLSGDLFTDNSCFGDGLNNPAMFRISNPDSPSPVTTVYANLPSTPNANIAFAPSGTIYAWAQNGEFAQVAQVSGTDGPSTATVAILPNVDVAALGLLAAGKQTDGDAETLFLNPFNTILNQTVGTGAVDLTTSPPSTSATLVNNTGANNMTFGPDGCVYAAQGDVVYKITATNGSCNYAAAAQPATLTLTPVSVTPSPAQGTSQTLTAGFHFTSAPAGTPIIFQVSGANAQLKMVHADASGQASFSYTAMFPGVDTIVASSTLGTTNLTSNNAVITWTSGQHTSFLSLNLSPTGVMVGKPVTLVGSLSDVSVTPAAPVVGASVQLTLEGDSCFGTTNANGTASCTLTPTVPEIAALNASFIGNSALLPAVATQSFNVTAPPTTVPTFTPRPTATSTLKPTPKPTPTPTPMQTLRPPTRTPTRRPTRTPTPSPTPTPRECIATTPRPTVPVPTPTPLPGHPRITTVQSPVLAGASFTINGSGFTKGSEVNFFVSTSTGTMHEATLKPAASSTTTQLVVPVPATISLGQGFVSVVVVNTDQVSFPQSNPGFALLQGSAAAGLPSITGLDGFPLASSSLNPGFAVANVETTLLQGSSVAINDKGKGFDTIHGVAVDVFCACPETGGKLKTMFLNPGNPGLISNSLITFTLPPTTPTGPGSIIVSNKAGGSYSAKSNAVSVPLGARINVTDVTQSGDTLTVFGTGFSTLTVINLFNAQAGKTVNLGGLKPNGTPKIPLTLISSTKFTFTRPMGAAAGPAFIEAFNPPFLPFTSSGNDPCGAFTLK